MKKTFLVIVGLLTMTVATVVRAQDTIDGRIPRDNYLYCGCPSIIGKVGYAIECFGGLGRCGGEMAKRQYTNDSLTVYGIAAGLRESFSEVSVYDTSYDNCYEFLRLYLPYTSTLQMVRQAKVHLRHTPVSYYANYPDAFGLYSMVPMYERYFDSAITVTDSFYVGVTFSVKEQITVDNVYYSQERRSMYLLYIVECIWGPRDGYVPCEDTIFTIFNRCEGGPLYIRGTEPEKYIIYPILTPPDSNYVPDDSLSADSPAMLQRLTGVMPNPAAEKARVVSSFGMSMVKVYNASGALVHTQRADGLYVDLDVSRWPAGTYLVRIHTPQGIATKRLVVTR